jgi:hypothetical protein
MFILLVKLYLGEFVLEFATSRRTAHTTPVPHVTSFSPCIARRAGARETVRPKKELSKQEARWPRRPVNAPVPTIIAHAFAVKLEKYKYR